MIGNLSARLFFLLMVTVLSACAGVKQKAANVTQPQISVTNCPTPAPTNGIEVLGAQTPMTKGWSHILNPEKINDFIGLQYAYPRYAISQANLQADPHCKNEATFQAILVKKFHVWNNNHSNGIETHVPALAVSQWQAIELVFRIQSNTSTIPSPAKIQSTFPELAETELAKIDKGQANIHLVFRDGEMEASYLLSLAPERDFDKWLHLTIPVEALQFSRKINYVHTPLTYQDVLLQHYQSVGIKAETASLKTVQHLNAGKEPANRLFKEIDIHIYRLTLIPR